MQDKTAASRREGCRFDSHMGAPLSGVSQSLCGFPPDTTASSHSPKTQATEQTNWQLWNCLLVWMSLWRVVCFCVAVWCELWLVEDLTSASAWIGSSTMSLRRSSDGWMVDGWMDDVVCLPVWPELLLRLAKQPSELGPLPNLCNLLETKSKLSFSVPVSPCTPTYTNISSRIFSFDVFQCLVVSLTARFIRPSTFWILGWTRGNLLPSLGKLQRSLPTMFCHPIRKYVSYVRWVGPCY